MMLLCALFAMPTLVGCESSSEPQGPEMGSIAEYLEANPEEMEDDPEQEAQDEGEAFDASGS
ncbi:MAG: hypothetical protein AAGJ83_15700 [Planctomycetota bacterium]